MIKMKQFNIFKDAMKNVFSNRHDVGVIDKALAPVRGEFKISTIEDGEEVLQHHDKNTIVKNSFNIMSSLLVNANTNKKIDTIKIGDGGIISSVIQTPSVNDTSLYNEIYEQAGTTSVTIESILEKSITFRFLIAKTDGNGTGVAIYNEAGLASTDGTLYARKTFTEIIKTPEKEILIEWKIIFN